MQFGGSSQESASAAAVIVALWLSESASRGGFSFSAPKCEFLGPTRGNNHDKKTSEDSGLRMAKKTVAVEVKCAVETTSRHLYVQRTRRGRERRAEEEKSANCPPTQRARAQRSLPSPRRDGFRHRHRRPPGSRILSAHFKGE